MSNMVLFLEQREVGMFSPAKEHMVTEERRPSQSLALASVNLRVNCPQDEPWLTCLSKTGLHRSGEKAGEDTVDRSYSGFARTPRNLAWSRQMTPNF